MDMNHDNYDRYNDGCNQCSCGVGGFPICTLRACPEQVVFENTCTACIDGYEPSEDGKSCVEEEEAPSCGGFDFCISLSICL